MAHTHVIDLEFTDVPLGTAQLVLTLLLAFQPRPKTKRTKSLCEYVFSCEAVGRTPVLQKAAVRTALCWSFAFFWKVS